jgi:undecaprenyl-diphosphatase
LSVLQAIVLAILQGVTEFLPVSSSGHLVLAQELLNLHDKQMMAFDVFVHFGTLMSVVFVFWKDIREILRSFIKAFSTMKLQEEYVHKKHFRLGIAILVGSLPAGVVGVLYRHEIEAAFTDPKLVAMNLVITGLILFLTRLARPVEGKKIGIVSSFIIGLAQMVAILPGISRSGSTMSTAMYLKIPPVRAARFSFLLSIPAIAGASLLEGYRIYKYGSSLGILPLLIGTAVSAIAGYFAIMILLKIMEKGKFSWFSVYCLTVGILGILFI